MSMFGFSVLERRIQAFFEFSMFFEDVGGEKLEPLDFSFFDEFVGDFLIWVEKGVGNSSGLF